MSELFTNGGPYAPRQIGVMNGKIPLIVVDDYESTKASAAAIDSLREKYGDTFVIIPTFTAYAWAPPRVPEAHTLIVEVPR